MTEYMPKMQLKVFISSTCPKCPEAKAVGNELAREDIVDVSFYQVDSPDGLAEASFYGIRATPSMVLVDGDDNEIASWRGQVPSRNEITRAVEAGF